MNKGYKKSVWSSVLGDIGITSGRKYLEVKIIKFENPSNGWVQQNSPHNLPPHFSHFNLNIITLKKALGFGVTDLVKDFEFNHFAHKDNLQKGVKRAVAFFATGKISKLEQNVASDIDTDKSFGMDDRVGVLLDFRDTFIQFFVNGEPAGPSIKFSFDNSSDLPLVPALSLNSGPDNLFEVMIIADATIPSPPSTPDFK